MRRRRTKTEQEKKGGREEGGRDRAGSAVETAGRAVHRMSSLLASSRSLRFSNEVPCQSSFHTHIASQARISSQDSSMSLSGRGFDGTMTHNNSYSKTFTVLKTNALKLQKMTGQARHEWDHFCNGDCVVPSISNATLFH